MKSFFDRLRSKKAHPDDTVKIKMPSQPSIKQKGMAAAAWVQLQPQQLLTACAQSIGKQRDHNEDSVFTFTAAAGGETGAAPMGLFLLADGMGGYLNGEVASATAIRSMTNILLKQLHGYLVNPSNGLQEPLQELMRAAMLETQRVVLQAAIGGGTTLTAVLVLGSQVTIGHVGDSRAYALHADGRAEALTQDHTLVKRLEELGQITAEEALTHPQRNVLYRAIGQGEMLEPDVFTTSFPSQGILLLCSDGLWSVVPDGMLSKRVSAAPNLQSACQDLISAANDAGGPDNISVILVQSIG